MKRLSKQYLAEMRAGLLIDWNIVGSKIELIDHLLAEPEPEVVEE